MKPFYQILIAAAFLPLFPPTAWTQSSSNPQANSNLAAVQPHDLTGPSPSLSYSKDGHPKAGQTAFPRRSGGIVIAERCFIDETDLQPEPQTPFNPPPHDDRALSPKALDVSPAPMLKVTDPDSCDLDSINLSTGRDFSMLGVLNPPSRDPHWLLVSDPILLNQSTQSYVIDESSMWSPPVYGTQWISSSALGASSSNSGKHVYERKFYLNSTDNTLEMSMRYLVDDSGTVIVNGNTVISGYLNATIPYQPPVLNSSYLNDPGWNTIQSIVWGDGGPHGFDLEVVLKGCEGVFSDSVLTMVAPGPADNPLAQITLYPNPVTHVLHVVGAPLESNPQYSISDVEGRLLIKTIVPDIDVRPLPAGVYFLRIETLDNSHAIRFSKY